MTTTANTTPVGPRVIRRNSTFHLALCGLGVLAVALLLNAVAGAGAFTMTQVTRVLIYATAIVGLNIVTGYAGIISVGHSAFFGLGAYTTAILVTRYNWPPEATLPVAFVVCFVAGLIVGLPSLRIRGLYLVMVTLALAVSFPELIDRFDGLTGGSQGIRIRRGSLRPPGWTGFSLAEKDRWIFYLSIIVLLIALVLAHNLRRSRWGMALIAARDNELAAQATGVDVGAIKIWAFGISGGITGTAGTLFAMYLGTLVARDSFALQLSVFLLTGLMVGGIASRLGPVLGAVLVVYLPYYTADLGSGQVAPVLFSIALILIMFIARTGIAGGLFSLLHRFVVVRPDPRRHGADELKRGEGEFDTAISIDDTTTSIP